MNVAQLKLGISGASGVGDGEGFPRSYERGSIEAQHRGLNHRHSPVFPRSYERGSIEA